MKKRIFPLLFVLTILFSGFVVSPVTTGPVIEAEASSDFNPFDSITMDKDGVDIGDTGGEELDFGGIMDKYRNVLYVIAGIIVATVFFMLFFNLYRLSTAGSNDRKRHDAISGILFCGIAVALLGGFGVVISIAFGLFQ